MATPKKSQPLPSKEEALFRQLVRLHESKQYKKGIKTADLVRILTLQTLNFPCIRAFSMFRSKPTSTFDAGTLTPDRSIFYTAVPSEMSVIS